MSFDSADLNSEEQQEVMIISRSHGGRILSSFVISNNRIVSHSVTTFFDCPTSCCSIANCRNNNNNNNSEQWNSYSTTRASIRGDEDDDVLSRKRKPAWFWKDTKNHHLFFEKLSRDLNITHLDDWYKVTTKQVHELGGRGLLDHYYGGSLMRALRSIYPDHEWKSSSVAPKTRAPSGFWKNLENQRSFFDKLGREEFNIKQLDDWYGITVKQVISRGGKSLLATYYKGSLLRALRAVYPEHPWKEDEENPDADAHADANATNNNNNNTTTTTTAIDHRNRSGKRKAKKSKVPYGHWNNLDNQRQFFDRISRELGVVELDDWYKVTVKDVASVGGKGLLNDRYGGSLARALQAVYPEHPWQLERLQANKPLVPRGHWKDISAHRQFFDQLGRDKLNIKQLDDWYGVTIADVRRHGGRGLLMRYYGGSLMRALKAVYPEHPWTSDNPRKVGYGHWKDLANQRKLFDAIAAELGFTNLPDDWYSITLDDVTSRGGSGLLMHYYGNSVVRALRAIYPEHEWEPWRFSKLPWSSSSSSLSSSSLSSSSSSVDDENALLSAFLTSLSKQLAIGHLDDWYRVSLNQIRDSGGHQLIKRNGGLLLALKRVYPEHDWDPDKFTKANTKKKKSEQRWLLLTIEKLFPNAGAVEEYHHPELQFSGSSQTMELDVYVPSLRLAFEYHGEQHYSDVYAFGSGSHHYQRKQDAEKVAACNNAGITLISIPYWWDRKPESLAATVLEARPDLRHRLAQGVLPVSGACLPIPTAAPASSSISKEGHDDDDAMADE